MNFVYSSIATQRSQQWPCG